MNRTQYRLLSILATGAAALTVGRLPALAGSDGCSGADCQDENAPAPVVPAPPTPVTPARPRRRSAGGPARERLQVAPRPKARAA